MEHFNVIIQEFWGIFCEMSWYLLFGFFMAGILHVMIPEKYIEDHLGKSGVWQVVKASLAGVPIPLCSCSVIPVAAGLRKHGASKAATLSFLISTPQTGVDSLMVTYSLLGPIYAVFRAVSAFLSGVAGGILSVFSEKESEQSIDIQSPKHASGNIREIMQYGFITLPADINVSLLVGVFISALITAFIPEHFFADFFGGNIIFSMFLMVIAGIPMYVCSTASVPVAAALVMKGISPGAALVFLMTGPATNAATMAVVYRTMGKKTLVIYLFAVIATAVFSGIIFDFAGLSALVSVPDFSDTGDTDIFKTMGGMALALLMIYSWLKSRKKMCNCSCSGGNHGC